MSESPGAVIKRVLKENLKEERINEVFEKLKEKIKKIDKLYSGDEDVLEEILGTIEVIVDGFDGWIKVEEENEKDKKNDE